MSGKHALIEQLGAASTDDNVLGVSRTADLMNKLLPGAVARYKVARDDAELNGHTTSPFIEQLGVSSGRYGLPSRGRLGAALMGLYARVGVSRYWGIDYRSEANAFIEQKILPLPMDDRKKALLITKAESESTMLRSGSVWAALNATTT